MDQDNTPKFGNEPYQPTSTGPDQPPAPSAGTGGAQVYDDQNFQPTTGPSFSPPPPPYYAPPAQPPKNNNRRIWLIILIVVLALCCCCLILLVVAWNNGDAVLIQMCAQDPTLPFCSQLMP